MMIGLLPFFISCVMGYFILRCLKEEGSSFDLKDIFVMVGVGLGISTQIVFYAFLILDRMDPAFIVLLHLVCLCILFLYIRRYRSKQVIPFSFSFCSLSVVLCVVALVAMIAAPVALTRPWGDWDGWAYWNFHANFLFKAGHEWRRLFEFDIQSNHPWMLPLLIIWGWCFGGTENVNVSLLIGMIFTVVTVGLLIGSLKKYIPFYWAVLGGLFLASIPFYVIHGTSQYADIEAAYFILLSVVLVLDLLKSPSVNAAILTGLCLGLTATVKENSIVAAFLLMGLIIRRLFKMGETRLIRPLSWGFIAIALSVVLMKVLEGYHAYGHTYDVFLPGLWDFKKWMLIGQFVWRTFTYLNWGGLWLLALVICLAYRDRWVKKEACILISFIAAYIIFYFFVYAASALKLEWFLGVSFDRMLYLLAPALVFIIFYIAGAKE